MLSVLPPLDTTAPTPVIEPDTFIDSPSRMVESRMDTHSLRKKLSLDDIDFNSTEDPPPLIAEGTQSKPRIVGHRGALYQELENTMEGFRYCSSQGIDAVELDVFLVAGELVVFHGGGSDENPGLLSDYCLHQKRKSILDCTSIEEIQALQFNPDCHEFGVASHKIPGAQIPTLRDVLLWAKQHPSMTVKIELKGPGVTIPALELVQEMGLPPHQIQYSSFRHERIALVRQLHPERDPVTNRHVYNTGALFKGGRVPDTFIADAQQVGASEVHLQYDDCNTHRIQQIHDAGMGSMAYFRGPVGMKSDVTTKYWDVGLEDARMYQSVLQTGVEQMCCNRPVLLKEMLHQV